MSDSKSGTGYKQGEPEMSCSKKQGHYEKMNVTISKRHEFEFEGVSIGLGWDKLNIRTNSKKKDYY